MLRILTAMLVVSGCAHGRSAPPRPLPLPVAPAPSGPRPTPPTVVLAAQELAHVADAGGEFPSMLGTPGPRLVLAVLDEPPPFAELAEPGVIDVADERLAGIGVPRPPAVWLVTPKGACEAGLGSGYVGHYVEGPVAYEVGYHLEPCAPGFGPVAVLAEEVPTRLRWIPAIVELDEPVEPEVELEAWAHPQREAFLELGLGSTVDDTGQPAPQRRVRKASVPGTPLQQLIAVDHWPAQEPCDEQEAVTIGTGLWDGTAMRWLVPPEALAWDTDDPLLLGALVDGDVPVVVVLTVEFQAGLGIRDAAGEYRWLELATGLYHDEDVAYAGYSVRQYCGP